MPVLRPLRVPDTAPLFAPLTRELLALLRDLEPDDWDRPTVAGAWRVRDVVAHLLDAELRKLAAHRDGHLLSGAENVQSYVDVMSLIGRLNAEGVAFGRRMSARLLIDLLETTGRWMNEFVATLDPEARALFSVAWAGESESTNRFDTAREYTERWHHQMQIRHAVGVRGHPELLRVEGYAAPLLNTSARVLPHAYRDIVSSIGTAIVFSIYSNDAARWSLDWTLRREDDNWHIYLGAAPAPTARVSADVDVWWRLFFNALPAANIPSAFIIDGSDALVAPLWNARSVMV